MCVSQHAGPTRCRSCEAGDRAACEDRSGHQPRETLTAPRRDRRKRRWRYEGAEVRCRRSLRRRRICSSGVSCPSINPERIRGVLARCHPTMPACLTSLKGMASMAGNFAQPAAIKAKMEEVKNELGRVSVEAETGGGAVHSPPTARCASPCMSIRRLDGVAWWMLRNADDRAMAEDPIAGAVNAALAKGQRARRGGKGQRSGGELNLPIPARH